MQGTGDPTDTAGFSITPDNGSLFVVDEDRELIVSVPEIRGFPEGKAFDAGESRGLSPLVKAALRGEKDPGKLSIKTPEGRVLAVTPIEGKNGKVAGVLIGTLRLPNRRDRS